MKYRWFKFENRLKDFGYMPDLTPWLSRTVARKKVSGFWLIFAFLSL